MTNNGLDIKLDQFKKMKSMDRDVLMYNNLVFIRKKIGDVHFHRKITYTWLFIISVFVGIKKYIGL